jgi:hypothetical protein
MSPTNIPARKGACAASRQVASNTIGISLSIARGNAWGEACPASL